MKLLLRIIAIIGLGVLFFFALPVVSVVWASNDFLNELYSIETAGVIVFCLTLEVVWLSGIFYIVSGLQ